MLRFVYALAGLFAGSAVPLAWFLLRAFSTRRDWWLTWGKAELSRHFEIYVVLSIVSMAACAVIGFIIGSRKSDFIEEAESIKDSNLQLEELASTDGLTSVFNARAMRERLDIELENSHRTSLICLLVDLDYFKKINDRYGHPFGDAVLIKAAQIMKRTVRRMDVVGRLGGEEFLIILPDTPPERGVQVAERLREAIAQETFALDDKTAQVTASIGVAATTEILRDGPGLLKAADQALYEAKKAGRNRVVLFV